LLLGREDLVELKNLTSTPANMDEFIERYNTDAYLDAFLSKNWRIDSGLRDNVEQQYYEFGNLLTFLTDSSKSM
jgi:hypothetical protein